MNITASPFTAALQHHTFTNQLTNFDYLGVCWVHIIGSKSSTSSSQQLALYSTDEATCKYGRHHLLPALFFPLHICLVFFKCNNHCHLKIPQNLKLHAQTVIFHWSKVQELNIFSSLRMFLMSAGSPLEATTPREYFARSRITAFGKTFPRNSHLETQGV